MELLPSLLKPRRGGRGRRTPLAWIAERAPSLNLSLIALSATHVSALRRYGVKNSLERDPCEALCADTGSNEDWRGWADVLGAKLSGLK